MADMTNMMLAADAVTENVAEVTQATTEAVQEATHLIIPSFLQGYVDKAIGAAIVAILTFIVVKIVLGAVNHVMERMSVEMTLKKFVNNVAKFVAYFLMVLIIAGALGINTSSVVALASVLSAAFALAAQGALGNLFGGILLLLTKPFLVGDYVIAGGVEGTVLEIGLLSTRMNTLDNKRVSVPNGSISSATITNCSTEGKRRVDITVTASYDSPVETTKKAILQAVAATPKTLSEPAAPFARVSNYGESSIEYTIRVWCLNADYWDVYFDLMENLKVYFDKNGVEMTYNHVNVHMMKD
jgi:small conductance mechanosensitive channel